MKDKPALRLGVGGPVGSGKTALVDTLCKRLRERYQIAVVTNDIYTREDADFLLREGDFDTRFFEGRMNLCVEFAANGDPAVEIRGPCLHREIQGAVAQALKQRRRGRI